MNFSADREDLTLQSSHGRFQAVWREDVLTRAVDLEALLRWISEARPDRNDFHELGAAIDSHLAAAREAAVSPRRGFERRSARLARAFGNLNAAEVQLLQLAPAQYLLGELPGLVNRVQRNLDASDRRRAAMERVAKLVQLDEDRSGIQPGLDDARLFAVMDDEHGRIISAVREANAVELREQTRASTFLSFVRLSAGGMLLVAIALAVTGFLSPSAIPLCFAPEEQDQVRVVCPTQESDVIPAGAGGVSPAEIDAIETETVSELDLPLVELMGVVAASIAAVGSILRLQRSKESFDPPLALALLKLPTGAVTAVLGLLLMRAEFVPGLGAPETSAQILAWALVFGYAQQLLTRLIDQQASSVFNTSDSGT